MRSQIPEYGLRKIRTPQERRNCSPDLNDIATREERRETGNAFQRSTTEKDLESSTFSTPDTTSLEAKSVNTRVYQR